MLIRTGFDICFRTWQPIPTMLLLSVLPEHEPQLRTVQRIVTEPEIQLHHYRRLWQSCHALRAAARRHLGAQRFRHRGT